MNLGVIDCLSLKSEDRKFEHLDHVVTFQIRLIYPTGVATDDTDNIYVSSEHKLQKFTSSGELIKCIGRRGREGGGV